MSNCYDILNIPENSDAEHIKKAYETLLTVHNPKDDPAGYKALKKAYTKALKNVGSNKQEKPISDVQKSDNYKNNDGKQYEESSTDNYYDEIINDDYNSFDSQLKNENIIDASYEEENINVENDFIKSENNIEDFSSRLYEIYNDFSKRIVIENWKSLFESYSNSENPDVMQQMETASFNFIYAHKYIPYEVYELVDRYFKWITNPQNLYSKYDKNKVENVLNKIKNSPKLTDVYLKNIDLNRLEEYLNLRKDAYNYLDKNIAEMAYNSLIKAYEIYKDDVELHIMYSRYYFFYNNRISAEKSLKEALLIDKNNEKALKQLKKVQTAVNPVIEYSKPNKDKEKKSSSFGSIIISGIIVIKIICALINGAADMIHDNNHVYTQDEMSEQYYDHIEVDENTGLQIIKTSEDLYYVLSDERIEVTFDTIIPTDYYRVKCVSSEGENVLPLFNNEGLDKNNLRSNVVERIYLGKLGDTIILFGNTDFNAYEDNNKNVIIEGYSFIAYTADPDRIYEEYNCEEIEGCSIDQNVFIDTMENSDLNNLYGDYN